MGSSAVQQPEIERRTVTLELDELPSVNVIVRRNKRARHVRLNVAENGEVSASIPMRFALRRLDPIVRERGEWLANAIGRMHSAARATEVDLVRGDPVRLLGRWIPTSITTAGRPSARLIDEQRLELRVPASHDPYDVLERWYRAQARTIIGERVAHWAGEFGLQTGSLSIRDQRTRWGSCSHKGDLSFNWRLILAPLWVLDAIIVHELCHIEELNHSDRFWALVYDRYPRHDESSEWLIEHGPALRITRPGTLANPMSVPDELDQAPLRRRIRSRSDAQQSSLF